MSPEFDSRNFKSSSPSIAKALEGLVESMPFYSAERGALE